jgi:hypothetical protein
MTKDLFKRIEEIEKSFSPGFGDDLCQSWRDGLKKANINKKLLDIPEIKKLVNELRNIADTITEELAWNKELNKPEKASERISLWEKRDAYLYLTGFFGNPDEEIKTITKAIEENN